MHFVVLFVGCALFSTAFTLTCYECIPGADGSCVATQKTCPSSTQCAAMRVTSYAGASKVLDRTAKSCAAPAECQVTGSINYGISRTLLNSKCCTTDLCNFQNVPESSSSTPNGKQCFTCNGQDCLTTLKCLGDENNCISTTTEASGEKVSLKGCASKSMCGSLAAQLPGMSFKQDCCEGNLCNDARSLTASLLLLVAPLLSVALFH